MNAGLPPLSGGTAAAAPGARLASPRLRGGAALPGAERRCRSLPSSSIFVVCWGGGGDGGGWGGVGNAGISDPAVRRGVRGGFTGCFAALEHPSEAAAAGQREDDFLSQLATNARASCLLNNSAAANVVFFFSLSFSLLQLFWCKRGSYRQQNRASDGTYRLGHKTLFMFKAVNNNGDAAGDG